MRSIFLLLGVLVLGGCAAPPESRPCATCGDAPAKSSVLQRLGFGRPAGVKPKATILGVAPDPAVSTAPTAVDPGPTLSVEPLALPQGPSRSAGGAK